MYSFLTTNLPLIDKIALVSASDCILESCPLPASRHHSLETTKPAPLGVFRTLHLKKGATDQNKTKEEK